jgi:aminopeptidase N
LRPVLRRLLLSISLLSPAMAHTHELPAGEPAPGISRVLAQWRSGKYADVRYTLQLELAPALDRVRGSVRMQWRVTGMPADLVLDWRPASVPGLESARLGQVRVNGAPVDAQVVNDHVIVPASLLHTGENELQAELESPVHVAGTAVTRYRDREDGSDYVYTLLVPADASSLFPCIDQPDLKARFVLDLSVPAGWTAVSNAPAVHTQAAADGMRFVFAPTEPISTYLFAFAAGPFVELSDDAGGVRLFVRRSREPQARAAAAEVLRLNRAAMRYFADYFAQPFPFAKYDLVLLPEFAYGGMEHAGAMFLREDAVLFPFQPASTDLVRRAQLIFHETAHQWFGDLVTMRWFDDLWLKEGFANLMAYKAAQALLPDIDARNALRALKVSAYRTDVTPGTTPIWQELHNLSAAKSAYGNIVYSKAPGVLHQAEFFLGEPVFQQAVRDFLVRHRYASASWHDLVTALERASGRDLQAWSKVWVERAGVPEVRVTQERGADGAPAALWLTQHDSQGAGGIWPQRLKLLLVYADGSRAVQEILLEHAETRVALPAGRPAPSLVFANFEDRGYGVFLLDTHTRAVLQAELGRIDDAFLRALLWDAMWEAVRRGELSPSAWLELALRELPAERDDITVTGLLSNLLTALRWYLHDDQRDGLQSRVEAMLETQMHGAATLSQRIAYFRTYVAAARSPQARAALKRLLAGTAQLPGLTLRSAERYRVLGALTAAGDADAPALLAAETAADTTDDGRRFAYAARAARADPAQKAAYFEAYLHDPALPERWIEESLAAFNQVEQEMLTLAYLEPALLALPRLKRERRIFFVNGWLAAFIGGQRSAAAVDVVERFLQREDLDIDLRRKVLEAADGLRRTVRIRGTQSGPAP